MNKQKKYKARKLNLPLAKAGYSNQSKKLKKDNERLTRDIRKSSVYAFRLCDLLKRK